MNLVTVDKMALRPFPRRTQRQALRGNVPEEQLQRVPDPAGQTKEGVIGNAFLLGGKLLQKTADQIYENKRATTLSSLSLDVRRSILDKFNNLPINDPASWPDLIQSAGNNAIAIAGNEARQTLRDTDVAKFTNNMNEDLFRKLSITVTQSKAALGVKSLNSAKNFIAQSIADSDGAAVGSREVMADLQSLNEIFSSIPNLFTTEEMESLKRKFLVGHEEKHFDTLLANKNYPEMVDILAVWDNSKEDSEGRKSLFLYTSNGEKIIARMRSALLTRDNQARPTAKLVANNSADKTLGNFNYEDLEPLSSSPKFGSWIKNYREGLSEILTEAEKESAVSNFAKRLEFKYYTTLISRARGNPDSPVVPVLEDIMKRFQDGEDVFQHIVERDAVLQEKIVDLFDQFKNSAVRANVKQQSEAVKNIRSNVQDISASLGNKIKNLYPDSPPLKKAIAAFGYGDHYAVGDPDARSKDNILVSIDSQRAIISSSINLMDGENILAVRELQNELAAMEIVYLASVEVQLATSKNEVNNIISNFDKNFQSNLEFADPTVGSNVDRLASNLAPYNSMLQSMKDEKIENISREARAAQGGMNESDVTHYLNQPINREFIDNYIEKFQNLYGVDLNNTNYIKALEIALVKNPESTVNDFIIGQLFTAGQPQEELSIGNVSPSIQRGAGWDMLMNMFVNSNGRIPPSVLNHLKELSLTTEPNQAPMAFLAVEALAQFTGRNPDYGVVNLKTNINLGIRVTRNVEFFEKNIRGSGTEQDIGQSIVEWNRSRLSEEEKNNNQAASISAIDIPNLVKSLSETWLSIFSDSQRVKFGAVSDDILKESIQDGVGAIVRSRLLEHVRKNPGISQSDLIKKSENIIDKMEATNEVGITNTGTGGEPRIVLGAIERFPNYDTKNLGDLEDNLVTQPLTIISSGTGQLLRAILKDFQSRGVIEKQIPHPSALMGLVLPAGEIKSGESIDIDPRVEVPLEKFKWRWKKGALIQDHVGLDDNGDVMLRLWVRSEDGSVKPLNIPDPDNIGKNLDIFTLVSKPIRDDKGILDAIARTADHFFNNTGIGRVVTGVGKAIGTAGLLSSNITGINYPPSGDVTGIPLHFNREILQKNQMQWFSDVSQYYGVDPEQQQEVEQDVKKTDMSNVERFAKEDPSMLDFKQFSKSNKNMRGSYNFFNMRATEEFSGVVSMTSDGFSNFDSMENSWRAFFYVMRKYLNEDPPRNTVSLILNKYSPPSENNTPRLIKDLSEYLHVSSDEVLKIDPNSIEETLKDLAFGIILQEGTPGGKSRSKAFVDAISSKDSEDKWPVMINRALVESTVDRQNTAWKGSVE